ncbi:heterokaryon incompatibility protein-domain-containing protein [Xylariaceae sp. FL0662B]|nr:heterokaryon incompatibility protein-domain-containing protein [Xylariaceae sp. FL0662B]
MQPKGTEAVNSPQITTTYPGEALERDASFRLLELQPGEPDDPLIVRLFTTSLNERPEYEALSYTWGDTALTKQVWLLGHSDPRSDSMAITDNCHSALKRLRLPDTSRALWIDSICINQNFVPERDHQLRLMSKIFANARRVVVYLGESSDGSDDAMKFIRKMGTRFPFYHDFQLADFPEVSALLQRPWFARVWVLQEVAFARDVLVYCGAEEVSWDQFQLLGHSELSFGWRDKSSALIQRLPYVVSTPFSSSRYPTSFGKRLFRKLIDTRHCGATDARDKLFAVIPLLDQENPFGDEDRLDRSERYLLQTPDKVLPPDIVRYSNTPAQVFTDLAHYLLETVGLAILREVVGPSTLPGLPSWVPDWSVKPKYMRGDDLLEYFLKGSLHPPRRLSKQPPKPFRRVSRLVGCGGSILYQLHIPAVKIGTIQFLGDKWDSSENCFPLAQWESLVPESTPPERTPKHNSWPLWHNDDLSAFQKLLVMDTIAYPRDIIEACQRIHQYNEDYRRPSGYDTYLTSKSNVPLNYVMNHMPPDDNWQVDIILNSCDGRRFFVDKSGLLGLAPEEARVGDSVYALEGMRCPFILREVENVESKGDRVFRLIGECYVQDITCEELWYTSNLEEIAIL